MLDHVTLGVSDFARSRAFYDAALAPLGLSILAGGEGWAGYGSTRPFFWIGARPVAGGPTHVAIQAADRAQVALFHVAALAAGGADNGAPGLRPQYHPTYFGSFVLDPDGNNIEAVCHGPA